MSEIRAGDLVYVASGTKCCGHLTGCEGSVHRVIATESIDGECLFCGAWRSGDSALITDSWISSDRLKRIPPPSEHTHTDQQQELTA